MNEESGGREKRDGDEKLIFFSAASLSLAQGECRCLVVSMWALSRLRGLLFGPRVEGFALRARKKRGGVPLAKGQNSSAPFRRIPRRSSHLPASPPSSCPQSSLSARARGRGTERGPCFLILFSKAKAEGPKAGII